MKLQLYMTVPATSVLGPGKRFGIWAQGCEKHCKGCIAPDSWDRNGGYERTVSDLAGEILSIDLIEGITISGGEPFLQQDALCELIHTIQKKKNLGVIIYTGMKYEEISSTELSSLADLIIDGEYIENQNDGKSLRGSANQRAICVTERYRDFVKNEYGIDGRKIEITIKDGKANMVGIPIKHL